ncbi:MAG: hypothetical protein IJB22_07005 [Clostridia bacterium]|nr:hypothetical protein [Clostridia bacterium]MBQ7113867.1 hypothetical protein [Clostridia bacterium]
MTDLLFLLYVGAIPAVPLFGAEIYKRRRDPLRRNVCYALFLLQLLISIAAAHAWLSAR